MVLGFLMALEISSVGFYGVPGEKTFGAGTKTNNTLNPHMTLWEASVLTNAMRHPCITHQLSKPTHFYSLDVRDKILYQDKIDLSENNANKSFPIKSSTGRKQNSPRHHSTSPKLSALRTL